MPLASIARLDIRLARFDRIYRPGEAVTGDIVVTAKDGWSHQGIKLNSTGCVTITLPNSSAEVNPKVLLEHDAVVSPPGRFQSGDTKVPFSFIVKGLSANSHLLESYHGAHIKVSYAIRVSLERGVMKRGLEKEIEFIVEVPVKSKGKVENPETVNFDIISPKSLGGSGGSSQFTIKGKVSTMLLIGCAFFLHWGRALSVLFSSSSPVLAGRMIVDRGLVSIVLSSHFGTAEAQNTMESGCSA